MAFYEGLSQGGSTDDKLGLESALLKWDRRVIDAVLQELPGKLTHLVDRLHDRRQRRREVLGLLDAVATDERDFLADCKAEVRHRPMRAEGHVVVVAEDSVDI